MTKTEVLEQIVRKVPRLKEKLSLDRIYFNRAENHAVFSFLAAELIGQEEFRQIKAVLFGCFPEMRVSVRVASPALGEAFLRDPSPYQEPVLDFLCRRYPTANAWRKWLRLGTENGRVELETPDAFSAGFLSKSEVKQDLSQAIHDIFRVDTEVRVSVRGDTEALMSREISQRAAEEELMQPIPEAPKKEKKPSMQIRGREIASEPTPIVDITPESGRVTIRGKVLNVETRESKDGSMLILNFAVTDLTSSIRCVAFLRYRADLHVSTNIDIVFRVIGEHHRSIRLFPQDPRDHRRRSRTVCMDQIRSKTRHRGHRLPGKRIPCTNSAHNGRGIEALIRNDRIRISSVVPARIGRCPHQHIRTMILLQILRIIHHHIHYTVDHRREFIIQQADFHRKPSSPLYFYPIVYHKADKVDSRTLAAAEPRAHGVSHADRSHGSPFGP